MTNDLGVWTSDDCALVLIDYQKEMFEVIRSETSADLVEMQVRLLAKTAKAFGLPIVLTTVGVGFGFNGPTLPSILSELDGIEPIDRSSMNAFEDEAFRESVEATGRKRLIIGGLHTEICLTFAMGPGAEGRVRGVVRHRRPRSAWDEVRLRRRLLRGVHRADRRAQHEVLPDRDRAGRVQVHHDRRGSVGSRGRRGPRRLASRQRRAVRLLPARPDAGGSV